MAYRMTAARKAALRKAQVASARKRKGRGKGKSTKGRRLRRGAALVGAVGAVAGAGYVYKNRERLVISKGAEMLARRKARKANGGKKLSKTQRYRATMNERRDHASRSTFRVREYTQARQIYREVGRTRSLNPKSKNKAYKASTPMSVQNKIYNSYRKDVNARATARLNRIKGKKQNKFGYGSGKVKVVIGGRVRRLPF